MRGALGQLCGTACSVTVVGVAHGCGRWVAVRVRLRLVSPTVRVHGLLTRAGRQRESAAPPRGLEATLSLGFDTGCVLRSNSTHLQLIERMSPIPLLDRWQRESRCIPSTLRCPYSGCQACGAAIRRLAPRLAIFCSRSPSTRTDAGTFFCACDHMLSALMERLNCVCLVCFHFISRLLFGATHIQLN